MTKRISQILFVVIFSLVAIFSYKFAYHREFLTFSDGAKFADIARNLASENGYTSNFSFYNSEVLRISGFSPVSRWIPPVMPLAVAGFFKIFGISDLSVIATSSFFFILLVVTSYLLGKKLWGKLVGALSAVAVATNVNFLEYATSGASETPFTFEIVLAAYLFILKKKKMNIIGFVVLILMYVTRPQAIIYIFGLLFLYFLLNYPLKKALSYAVGVIAISLVTLLATSKQGLFAVTQHLPGVAPSDALRGRIQNVGILEISKKLFYNLYNFYRLLPQIASPYMWGLFVIGSFHWTKNKVENSLKATTIFTVVATFLAAALTIPFFRYLHPVVPLVYLFAVSTLVWIVETVVSVQWSVFSAWLKNRSPFTVHRTHVVAIVSTVLILFFVVGQTLGVIFLDSRFKAKRVNRGKPPVYVQLSHILRGNTSQDDVVVTNLDTWGSWYGERKTVWYPLQPNQLAGLEDTIDAIFLTSYLIDDENYYMGREWRQAFLNPENIGDSFISENFDFKGIYTIKPEETNEKQEGRAVLFVKKSKNSKL